MKTGLPSRTAQSVAMRRAEHQLVDWPHVFRDPIAVRIIGPWAVALMTLRAPAAHLPVSRYLRAFIAARSRYAEDQLARAFAEGTRQYMVLGAGLDTFAYRSPYPPDALRTFEVDHPDTQAPKRQRLEKSAIRIPASVTYVPVDFERQELRAELERAGFKPDEPAFFSWLGCTPYLARETVMATFSLIHALCPDNGVVFDYARPRQSLSGIEKLAFDAIDASVGLAGEPFVTFFDTDELAADLRTIGFRHVEHPTTGEINARYFHDRLDRLRIRSRVGGLMCAY